MLVKSRHVFNSADVNHVKSSRPDNLEKSDQTKVLLCFAFHTESLPDDHLKVHYPSKSFPQLMPTWIRIT